MVWLSTLVTHKPPNPHAKHGISRSSTGAVSIFFWSLWTCVYSIQKETGLWHGSCFACHASLLPARNFNTKSLAKPHKHVSRMPPAQFPLIDIFLRASLHPQKQIQWIIHATEPRATERLYIPINVLPKMVTHDKHQALEHKSTIRHPSDVDYCRHN